MGSLFFLYLCSRNEKIGSEKQDSIMGAVVGIRTDDGARFVSPPSR